MTGSDLTRALAALCLAWCFSNVVSASTLGNERVIDACPAAWEGYYTKIVAPASDIWQGDMGDKARYIRFSSPGMIPVSADGEQELRIEGYNLVDSIAACRIERDALFREMWRDSQAAIRFDHAAIRDSDADGIFNAQDRCESTATNALVDENGCSNQQLSADADNDGVSDAFDQCPNTAGTANSIGCSPAQMDSDGDGVSDAADQCPNSTQASNAQGCDAAQVDTDNDGISDAADQCPNSSQASNAQGCDAGQIDSDNDGVNDADDQCPGSTSGLVGPDGCDVPDGDADNDGIPDIYDNTPTQCVDVSVFDAGS